MVKEKDRPGNNTGALPEPGQAAGVEDTPTGADRDDLHLYLDAVFGDGDGYVCAA